MKLNVKAFAISFAICWGVGLFLITWWIILLDGITYETTFIGRVYWGYSISPVGSIIGLIWATIDGGITGAIFAWLYNLIVSRISPKEAQA